MAFETFSFVSLFLKNTFFIYSSCPRIIVSNSFPLVWETNNCTTTNVGYRIMKGCHRGKQGWSFIIYCSMLCVIYRNIRTVWPSLKGDKKIERQLFVQVFKIGSRSGRRSGLMSAGTVNSVGTLVVAHVFYSWARALWQWHTLSLWSSVVRCVNI